MALIEYGNVTLCKFGKGIASGLSIVVGCGITFAFLREFAHFCLPCAVLVLSIIGCTVLDLVVGRKNIVVFIRERAMLHDVSKHTFLLFLGRQFVDYITVSIYNVGIFWIGCDNEWT